MRWLCCLVIVGVTRVAILWSAFVLAVDMTAFTLHTNVLALECEEFVVELWICWLPAFGGVAAFTSICRIR